ncbi:hypothetical protein K439DRAFT_298154 [Ramaria rubella]|nr:hypothetical protein K439DRAFT_298154 [Ramaria rubella]
MLYHVSVAAFAVTTTHDGTPPQFDKTPLHEDGSSSSKSPGEPQLDCITPRASQRHNHTSTAIPHVTLPLRSRAPTRPQVPGCTDSHHAAPIHSQTHAQMPPPCVTISQHPMPPRPPGAAWGSMPPSTAPVDLGKTPPPIVHEPHAKCACNLSLVPLMPTTTCTRAVSCIDAKLEKRLSHDQAFAYIQTQRICHSGLGRGSTRQCEYIERNYGLL